MNMQQLQLISKVVMFITFCIGAPAFITYKITELLISIGGMPTILYALNAIITFWLLSGLFTLMFQLSIMRFVEEEK